MTGLLKTLPTTVLGLLVGTIERGAPPERTVAPSADAAMAPGRE